MKLLLSLLLLTSILHSQTHNLSGTVKNSATYETLSNANIFIEELKIGTSSDEFGRFLFSNLKQGNYTIIVSYIGHETKQINVNLSTNKDIIAYLSDAPILLNKAIVKGTYPKFRETPVSFTELSDKDIELRLGSKEAVSILEGTPSAYISERGGGIGEQRLSIRGFDQTNIAVMFNGIPINNPEDGKIYWSNWAGISDLVDYIHIQRGLSATPYSTSAIGGSVNFVTTGSSNLTPSFRFRSVFGSDNLRKKSLSFTTSLTKNIGLTGLVSERTMDGFADQLYSDELTYYISLGMVFNNHVIQIQLFGAPQKHGMRFTPQTNNNWSKYGKEYNADWGYLNGKPLNLRDNEFHNPTLGINHNWQISDDLILTNMISLSRGTGGGTVPPWYPNLSTTVSGQIDFDKEWEINSNNVDSNFHPTLNKSVIALRKGVHKNYRGTLISTLKYNWNNFVFSVGIDGKLYKAQNYNELKNLLGGDYQIGSGNVNEHTDKYLIVGDKVDFNADSFTRNYGAFFQTEFKNDKISAYLNLAISNTGYNRIDYFNYLNNDANQETGWKNFTSTTVKAGLNYNFDSYNNIYLNIGNFSRAPLSNNVYDYSNNLYENTKNEKILSFEVGYGLKTEFSQININYYTTSWKDKAFSQAISNTQTKSIYYYSLFGASAKHTGIEYDGIVNLSNKLSVNTMFSYSLNKWKSDIDALVRPESKTSDEINYHAFTDNLYVGNFPMTTASIGVYFENEITTESKFYINPIYNYYGRYYAKFSPELRTDLKEKGIQPWRIPNFYNFDFHTGLEISIDNSFIKSLQLSWDIFNVLDHENIIDAIEEEVNSSKVTNVWYGRGRWWSTSFSVTL